MKTFTLREHRHGLLKLAAITLKPTVTLARAEDAAEAARLHDRAQALCFLANSCALPIRHDATVHIAREAQS